jgi:elongation factor G
MAHRPEDLRNVGLFGHAGSGKTALVDALAFQCKVSGRHGNSADGTSISNGEPEEKERKQTLCSHLFHFPVEKATLNVIDTPGHPDFLADAISAMSAVEIGILCVSAAAHVTFHARRLWTEMGRHGLGRAIVVTHVDGENADFEATLDELVKTFGDVVVPLTYPDASGPAFTKVHDVFAGSGPLAAKYSERLEERVAEADDEVLARYLEDGKLSRADLDAHFATALNRGKLVPLFVVQPPKLIGMQELAHDLVHEMPSPVAYGPRRAARPGATEPVFDQLLEPDVNGPFAGAVFKVVIDPYVGRLSYIRCLRGQVKADQGFLNVRAGKHEKVGGLLLVQGKETRPVDAVVVGDLFAVGKIEDLGIGDTVTADAHPLLLPRPTYPQPTFSLAVMPKSRGDEQKINQGLEKLATEDPTFHVHRDATTAELIVSGMSPLHLEMQLQRLLRRYGVGTLHHPPTIPYKETITSKADGHHRHKKQTGGRGQFGEVYLRVAPRERGAGFEFVDAVVGGSIPRQFIPEVEKGIRKVLVKGGLAGFPVIDVSAEVYDGKFHDVDSDQISFQIAGERAFAEGFTKARPILLEPIMEVEISVPERFTGDVAGNLSTIRGRMSGMEVVEGIQVIRAQVPLKEMQEYSTQLRSITAGEGTFTMRASHYEQVPPHIQADIIARYKKAQEEAHR